MPFFTNGMEFLKRIQMPFARLALFIIYFWFGVLKVVGVSPASELVQSLFERTMPMMHLSIPFNTFLILFGLFECLIGVLFLIPKLEKAAFCLLCLHMLTTFMPLFLVSGMWTGLFTPTLEAQYIIKNLLIISTAITVFINSRTVK
jgi:hypothetical protein